MALPLDLKGAFGSGRSPTISFYGGGPQISDSADSRSLNLGGLGPAHDPPVASSPGTPARTRTPLVDQPLPQHSPRQQHPQVDHPSRRQRGARTPGASSEAGQPWLMGEPQPKPKPKTFSTRGGLNPGWQQELDTLQGRLGSITDRLHRLLQECMAEHAQLQEEVQVIDDRSRALDQKMQAGLGRIRQQVMNAVPNSTKEVDERQATFGGGGHPMMPDPMDEFEFNNGLS